MLVLSPRPRPTIPPTPLLIFLSARSACPYTGSLVYLNIFMCSCPNVLRCQCFNTSFSPYRPPRVLLTGHPLRAGPRIVWIRSILHIGSSATILDLAMSHILSEQAELPPMWHIYSVSLGLSLCHCDKFSHLERRTFMRQSITILLPICHEIGSIAFHFCPL